MRENGHVAAEEIPLKHDRLLEHIDHGHSPGTFNDDCELLRGADDCYYAASCATPYTLFTMLSCRDALRD